MLANLVYHAIVIAAWTCSLVQANESQVLWERELDPETAARYELDTHYAGVRKEFLESKEAFDNRVKHLTKWRKMVKLELVVEDDGVKYFKHTYLGADRIKAAETQKWTEYALKNLVCGIDIGEFKFTRTGLFRKRSASPLFEDYSEVGEVEENFISPKGKDLLVKLFDLPRPIDVHQFLRRIVREDCRIEKTKFGLIVRSNDRWAKMGSGQGRSISWLSGDKLAIYVTGLGIDPDELAEHYGARFPSTLPADLKIDKTEWGREEMEFWLRKMGLAIERGGDDEDESYLHFGSCIYHLSPYVYVPVIDVGNFYMKPLDVKKAQFERIQKWWEERKAKSYWHTKYQMLVAKGESPEDLRAAEKKRKEDEREAKLNSPLTEEVLTQIKQKLIEKFEKNYQGWKEDRLKNHQPGMETKFEKVGEGVWEMRWGSTGGSLAIRTYSGPKLVRRPSKEWPLKGVFECTFVGHTSGQFQEVFYYNKLEDEWFYKIE